jgi:hypothetical protein
MLRNTKKSERELNTIVFLFSNSSVWTDSSLMMKEALSIKQSYNHH